MSKKRKQLNLSKYVMGERARQTFIQKTPSPVSIRSYGHLLGKKVGQLRVRAIVGYVCHQATPNSFTKAALECKCLVCNRLCIVCASNVKSGQTTKCYECGQLAGAVRKRKYGDIRAADLPNWRLWNTLKNGRLCQAWTASFEEFDAYLRTLGARPKKGYLIRPNKNKPYGPGNAEWGSIGQTFSTSAVRIGAETFTYASLARKMNVSRAHIGQLAKNHRLVDWLKRRGVKAKVM